MSQQQIKLCMLAIFWFLDVLIAEPIRYPGYNPEYIAIKHPKEHKDLQEDITIDISDAECGNYKFEYESIDMVSLSKKDEILHNETGTASPEQSCNPAYEEKCVETDFGIEECETKVEQSCKTVFVSECEEEYVEVCEKQENAEELCKKAPKKQCKEVPIQSCEDIPIQLCDNVAQKDCMKVLKKECDGYETNEYEYDVHDTDIHSYNYLFFPYVQSFKAQHASHKESNSGYGYPVYVKHGAEVAYGYGSEAGYGSPEVGYGAPEVGYGASEVGYSAPEAAYGAPKAKYGAKKAVYGAPKATYGAQKAVYGPPLDTEQNYTVVEHEEPEYHLEDYLVRFVNNSSNIKFNYLSTVPGCYPVIMPFISTLLAFFVDKVNFKKPQLLKSELEKAFNEFEPNFEEYSSSYDLYQYTVQLFEYINTAMQSNHIFSDYESPKHFGKIGSYYGVSLIKDLSIAKCDIQEFLPKGWKEFKEAISNKEFEEELIEELSYENITVEHLFFDHEDSTLSDTVYNTIGYNLTDVISPTNFTNVVYSKLETNFGVVTRMNEVQNTISSKLRSGYNSALKPRSISRKLLSTDLKEYKVAEEEKKLDFDALCGLINSTNVQSCWEMFVTESFAVVESDVINSYFDGMYLVMFAYFTEFQLTWTILIGLGAAMLFEFKGPLQTQLPCLYDIIESKDLEFEIEFLQNETSLFKSMVVPLGRHQFLTLPIRLIESAGSIISHDKFEASFTTLAEAAVKKISEMVEEGTLAENLEKRSNELKDWLVSIDVMKVLDEVVQILRTVMKYRWQLLSGNWSELVLLGDILVEHIEGDLLWNKLGNMMVGVVKERWNLINIFVKYYFEPYTVSLVGYLEWIAEDVEGNIRTITESIQQSDWSEYFKYYLGWWEQEVKDYFVCSSDEPEDLLFGFYNYVFTTIGYLEPSVRLFKSTSICELFDFCDETEENYAVLKERIDASKVKKAIIEVYTPFVEVKHELICKHKSILKNYWQYVLLF